MSLRNLGFTGSYGQSVGGVIAAFGGARLETVNCLFQVLELVKLPAHTHT